jgi:hypothetical protein
MLLVQILTQRPHCVLSPLPALLLQSLINIIAINVVAATVCVAAP